MAAGPLSDRQVLPYLLVYVGMFTAVSFIPATMTNVWDGLGAVWSVLLAVFGTLYIYHRNGGAHGQHFLQRIFAVGWVVAIRWLPVLFVAIVTLFAVLAALAVEATETTWYEFLLVAAAEALVYWRTGYHVADLANRTKAV